MNTGATFQAINALRFALNHAENGHPVLARGQLSHAKRLAADVLCPELYMRAVRVVEQLLTHPQA